MGSKVNPISLDPVRPSFTCYWSADTHKNNQDSLRSVEPNNYQGSGATNLGMMLLNLSWVGYSQLVKFTQYSNYKCLQLILSGRHWKACLGNYWRSEFQSNYGVDTSFFPSKPKILVNLGTFLIPCLLRIDICQAVVPVLSQKLNN